MSRPKLEDSSKLKSVTISIRVSEAEKLEIENRSKIHGTKPAKFIYDSIFDNTSFTKEVYVLPQSMLKEFALCGSNINQIAKKHNTIKDAHFTTEDKIRLREAHETIIKLFEMVSFRKV